jgi:hypothetical protein
MTAGSFRARRVYPQVALLPTSVIVICSFVVGLGTKPIALPGLDVRDIADMIARGSCSVATMPALGSDSVN